MKKIFILFISIVLCNPVYNQVSTILPSGNTVANASVADIRNVSAFTNPANTAYSTVAQIGFQVENRFLIPQLSNKSIDLILPSKLLNTGLSFTHFGYSVYHEMMLGLGFSRNFDDKFAMGLQFNYYTTYSISSNSYRGAFLPQMGLSVRLSPVFTIGFQSFNPFQTNIHTQYVVKRLPSVFSLGTACNVGTDLWWFCQVDKEISSGFRFATGIDYKLDGFSVKLGAYGSDYLIPCFGVEFFPGNISVGLNCELHPLLGLNTLAGLKYTFRSH